jgi:hypothetical protein
MRMKLFPLFVVIVAVLAFLGMGLAHADGLSWAIPGGIGTVQLPTSATDILPLAGYDFVQKQAITGASCSMLTLLKDFNGYVGAVGEWQTQSPNVQPYLSIGIDTTKYIPGLSGIANLQVQGFVRYVASTGQHLGSGVAVSYKFGGSTPPVSPTP